MNPWIPELREEHHDLDNRQECARNRRPQAGQEEQSENDSEDDESGRSNDEYAKQCGGPAIPDYRRGNQAQDEKPGTWQTTGERREEPAHDSEIKRRAAREEAPEGQHRYSFG
jgi:hypothetical protein